MIAIQNFKNITETFRKHINERFSIEKKHEDLYDLFRRYEISFLHLLKTLEKAETLFTELDTRVEALETRWRNSETSHQKNTSKQSFLDPDSY